MYKEWFEGTWGYRRGLPLASNQLKNDAHDLSDFMHDAGKRTFNIYSSR